MVLLSCDAKAATRLPKNSHATAGMDQRRRRASPLGLAQL